MTDQGLRIRSAFQKAGRQVEDQMIALLERYVTLLLDWNKKINLVSRKDTDNVWESHIAHSLAPLLKFSFPDGSRILDLGTGGGLPGIPWKIICPSIALTMVDSTQKKVNAVADMIKALGLDATEAVWGRAENLAKEPKYARAFDYLVARGVAPLDELVKLAHPFLAERERTAPPQQSKQSFPAAPALLAFKGGDFSSELDSAKRTRGFKSSSTLPLSFNGVELSDKKLVVVEFTL